MLCAGGRESHWQLTDRGTVTVELLVSSRERERTLCVGAPVTSERIHDTTPHVVVRARLNGLVNGDQSTDERLHTPPPSTPHSQPPVKLRVAPIAW